MWKRFLGRRRNWIGISLAIGFVLLATLAPLISPEDPKGTGAFKVVGSPTDPVPRPPGWDPRSRLGTLPGQIDVFHTVVWGTRNAMVFGLLAAAGASTLGLGVGGVAGYFGGSVSRLLMRAADAFLALPPIVSAVFLRQLGAAAVVGLGGEYFFNPDMFRNVMYFNGPPPVLALFIDRIDPLLVSLVLFSWMPYARLVNALVSSLRQSEFVEAARAVGCKSGRIIFRHLLPNVISPVIVLAARDVGSAVILQATMVVIGFGGNSPWGILLATGRNWIVGGVLNFWWVYLPVTIVMILFGTAWNLLGDGLSEAV